MSDLVLCVISLHYDSLHFYYAPSQHPVFLLVIPSFSLQRSIQILCYQQISLTPFVTRSLMIILIETCFYHLIFFPLFNLYFASPLTVSKGEVPSLLLLNHSFGPLFVLPLVNSSEVNILCFPRCIKAPVQ